MFDFFRKLKAYSTCNTDIAYLENKEARLEELKGMKERVILALCEIDDDFKYQYMYFTNSLNEPFIPTNTQNYSSKFDLHAKMMRELELHFDSLLAKYVNAMICSQSFSSYMQNVLNKENVNIQFCKDHYQEASSIIVLNKGEDVNICQKQIEMALLNFYSSKEYIEILHRSRLEEFKKR